MNIEELLQCFDSSGIPTHIRRRSEVYANPARYWFAVARVWLVNDHGEILCSKRGETVSTNPGKWQTYFGGHVTAGKTILETAVIELGEEVGVYSKIDDLYLIDKGQVKDRQIFFESYAVRFNGSLADVRLSEREVADVRWVGFEQYTEEVNKNPEEWCAPCTKADQRKISEWLNNAC